MISFYTATNGKTTKSVKNPTSTRSRLNILKFLSAFALVMLGVNGVMAQSNPTAQALPYTQNFGTTTFTSMPTGMAAWNTFGSNLTTQANARTSTAGGDAAVTAATSSQTGGGVYGYAVSSNARAYIQQSSNSTNGTNQIVAAINTGSGVTSINVSYQLELINGGVTTQDYGIELQYRAGTSGSWTNVTSSALTFGAVTTYTTSTLSYTVSGLTASTDYQIRWIVWRPSGSGNSKGVGIDNISISAAATPSIAISNGTIAAGTPNNGQTNVVLQRYDMAVTTANATLTGLTVTTAGTYAAADLTNLKCWYQTSTTFNSGTATLLSTKTTALGAGSQVFPTFTSQAIASGSTGYIFVTADIASGATNGNTINIGTTTFSNITFSSGAKTGTDPVAAGGVQTITVAVPDIALSSPAASSANITVGTTNNVVYRFELAITTATPSLTGVTINTSTGSNVSGDLTNLKCWYQTSTTFNAGTATLLSTKTTSLAAGTQVFPSLSSQSLTTGSTYYIFITADVPLAATPNNTIIVSAITTSDLTFATGNKTGTANASGTKTIIDCTPVDVTSAAASSASSSSVLTWVNPACYDEILIVAALASNTGTPTGNGSAYTGNLAYGSGTALGNGFVVYKGSTSSQTVTGLTNGTQYFYKYFTRRGTTWTSGTEVNATPNISGYYWNGASIATNPAAGGTGTWGTASSWRQPSASGAQATWADNNNAIFAGTAGTVSLDAPRVGTAFYINTNGYIFANSTTQTLTGPIILGNNVGCTFSPNVNIVTPANGTLNIGSVSGSGTANITINSAQNSTAVAQRINIARASSSITVPINIVSAGSTGTAAVAGIVATATGTSLSSAATITNNTAIKTVIGATNSNDITANGVISGSADLIFAAGASGGAGTVILGAVNTYTGATIFNAANSGVIRLGITNALPTGTNVTMANSSNYGGIFDLNGFNQTIGSLTSGVGVGSIRNNGATDATLTISGSTSPAAFALVIADGTTNKTLLTRAGTGTLTLSGANTYTGLTTVSGGTLQFNRTGGTTIPSTNDVSVSGGTLQISTNQTVNDLTLSGGTLQVDAGATLTINGAYTGGGTIVNNGKIVITAASAFPGSSTTISAMKDLEVNRSAGLSLDKNLSVTGTLTLTSGTLNIGSQTLTLSGGIARTSGTIDAATGTIVFTNVVAQTLPSSLFSGNINNLTLDGSGGVTLGNAPTLTGTLTLTSGILTTTATNLLTLDNGAAVSGVSNSSFVHGPVKKVGNTNFTFPVGASGTGYQPIQIANFSGTTASTDAFTAEYKRSSAAGVGTNINSPVNRVSFCEYWQLDRTNGTPAVDVTLHFNANSGCGGGSSADYLVGRGGLLSELRVCRWDGTQWVNYTTANSGTAPNVTLTASAVSSFSPFTVGATGLAPLPLKLLSFKGIKKSNKIKLDWITTDEREMKEIEVYRSKDGENLDAIGQVASKGETYNRYAFIDSSTTTLNWYQLNQDVYYRLKFINLDKSYEWSDWINVPDSDELQVNHAILIYPNPASSSELHLQSRYPNNTMKEVRIYDMTGKLVYLKDIGGLSQYSIDLHGFNTGMYSVRILLNQGLIENYRLMVQF